MWLPTHSCLMPVGVLVYIHGIRRVAVINTSGSFSTKWRTVYIKVTLFYLWLWWLFFFCLFVFFSHLHLSFTFMLCLLWFFFLSSVVQASTSVYAYKSMFYRKQFILAIEVINAKTIELLLEWLMWMLCFEFWDLVDFSDRFPSYMKDLGKTCWA